MTLETQSKMSQMNEGRMTRAVEEQTARIPSLGYLGFAVLSMGISAALAFGFKKKEMANFVGLWAPSILIMGLYNKVVKIENDMEGRSLVGKSGYAA